MAVLEKAKLFSDLPPEQHALLRRFARELRFAPGHQIFREGDPGDGLYILAEGKVEISVKVGAGAPHVFGQVGPGEVFGEMAVIEDEPRSASAVAVEAVRAWFLPQGDMLRLLAGSPELALGLMREISRRLREFDQQYLREVLQAERLAVVGRFARSIIHDLKNPLNVIGLTAEVAGMDKATPEIRKQAIENIRKQVDRITDMIGEILEFTQGSSGELPLARMDYSHFLHTVVSELRVEAELKGVRLQSPDPFPEVALSINPRRLRRVFSNLVNNALEAMNGNGSLSIGVQLAPGEVVT